MDNIKDQHSGLKLFATKIFKVYHLFFLIYKKCDVYEHLNNCLSGNSHMASNEETFSDVDSKATTVVV